MYLAREPARQGLQDSAQGFNRVSTLGTLKITVRPEAEGAREMQDEKD